jgi:hypothetical protein
MKHSIILMLLATLFLTNLGAQSKWQFSPKIGLSTPLYRFNTTITDPKVELDYTPEFYSSQFPQKGIVGGIAVQRNCTNYWGVASEFNLLFRENVWLQPLPGYETTGTYALYGRALILQIPVLGVFRPIKFVSFEGGLMGNFLLYSKPYDEPVIRPVTLAVSGGINFHIKRFNIGLRCNSDFQPFASHQTTKNTTTTERRQDIQVTAGWRF